MTPNLKEKIEDCFLDIVSDAYDMEKSIYSLKLNDLQNWLAEIEEPSFRAKQILEWLYTKRIRSFDEMTNLSICLRKQLASSFAFEIPKAIREISSGDDEAPMLEDSSEPFGDSSDLGDGLRKTRKFLWQFSDGAMVESVLIPASPALYGEDSDRRTLCISSQVGCAYGCRFCASGLDGWKRNLSAGEIVGQFLASEAVSGEKINNLVFMGMGEPLANYEQLMQAIAIINAPWGIGLGARHITVSTSGLVPQIRKLAEQPLQIRLAISLHGATDEVRDRIMPINRKYPLAELVEACTYYQQRKKQILTFEFILIRGVNDSPEQANELINLAKRLRAKVNLIPYNKVAGLEWERPSTNSQQRFFEIVRQGGVPVTIRREKGGDIAAACGQLRLATVKMTEAEAR